MTEEVKLTKAWDVHASFPFFFIQANGVEITISTEQFDSLYDQMSKIMWTPPPELGDMTTRRSMVDEQFIAEWREKAK